MQDKSIILEANYLILGKLSHKNAIKVVIKIHLLRFVKKRLLIVFLILKTRNGCRKRLWRKKSLRVFLRKNSSYFLCDIFALKLYFIYFMFCRLSFESWDPSCCWKGMAGKSIQSLFEKEFKQYLAWCTLSQDRFGHWWFQTK